MRDSTPRPSSILQPLHDWYQNAKRDLPWRKNPTPYGVWVSEIMLQQTQVRTVLPYYEKFLKRFPDFKMLAAAPESEVLAQWSGLGYYSRARNMHKCAQIIVDRFGGKFPRGLEEVKKLPGIGPYTAGAILSIAFNLPHPILDGNVRRILSRIFLEANLAELWTLSEKIISEASSKKLLPSDVNQSLMELGALVCLSSNPSCHQCPVRKNCLARQKGLQGSYPPAKKKQDVVERRFALYLVADQTDQKKFLICQRGSNERWFNNMWEFPMVEIPSKDHKKEPIRPGLKSLSQNWGLKVKASRSLGFFSHTITHHRLQVEVFEARLLSAPPAIEARCQWIVPADLSRFSASSLLRKALALLN